MTDCPLIEVRNRRILIVDDNQAIHADFRKILETGSLPGQADFEDTCSALFGEHEEPPAETAVFHGQPGYDIDSAFQGEEALEAVLRAVGADRPYAMAFVDVRMPPGWDGVETIRRIWDVYPQLQVVVCTAYSDYSWEEMVKQLCHSDRLLILKKPFDTCEVRQLASALTAKWNLDLRAGLKTNDLERMVERRNAQLIALTDELRGQNLELEAALATLQRTQGELLHSEKLASVGQLAAGVAHEINTPIQFIGDNLRACQDMFADLQKVIAEYRGLAAAIECEPKHSSRLLRLRQTEQAADVGYILTEAPLAFSQSLEGIQQIRTIVRSLKDFSRTNSSEDLIAFDINAAIENTLIVARNEFKYAAEVVKDFGELPQFCGRPGEINQVFLNLLVNAVHAIQDRKTGTLGMITIRTRADDDWIVISFSDTGCGIPDDVRQRIFEPFFTTKEVGRGSGQGLAISRNIIVKHHSGRIELETAVGVGTTFHIHLPLQDHATQECPELQSFVDVA
ncbi:MAG TPA: ATP-binding protein [Planctomycetaceae bacterium]|jgi:signal transduction histidine kinase